LLIISFNLDYIHDYGIYCPKRFISFLEKLDKT
jgi:hypothetical protein